MRAMLLISLAGLASGQVATLGPDHRIRLIPACMLRDDVALAGADQRTFLAECSTLERDIAALGARLRAQQGQTPPTARDMAEANRQRELLIQKSCARLDQNLSARERPRSG